ncbi:hypothetical protein ACA910_006138 [Epithemia clementina (nom. ined.)]
MPHNPLKRTTRDPPNELPQPKHDHDNLDDLSQLPSLRSRVREYVDEVIRCRPAAETMAYREAMRRDASLVWTETDPLQFVRYCDYDVAAGAQRLCLYWTERLALFGPDRAFLPLTLTGTGALTPQDLLTLRAGFPALLPNAAETGHSCILFDRRKKIPQLTMENHLRCAFYWHKVLAENDLSQVDHALIFIIAVMPRTKGWFDAEMVHRRAHLTQRIFPVKFRVHILSVPPKKKPSSGADLVHGVVTVLRRYFSAWMNIRLHVETEPNQIYQELTQQVGLTAPSIPLFLGGEWKYEDFSKWCQERMEQEYEQYKDRLLNHNNNKKEPNHGGSSSSSHDSSASTDGGGGGNNNNNNNGLINWAKFMAPDAVVPEEPSHKKNSHKNNAKTGAAAAGGGDVDPRVPKRRMADLLYSRQKRERQRVQFDNLKEESTTMSVEHERLQAEHERLHRLVKEAEECIAALSSPPDGGSRGGFF